MEQGPLEKQTVTQLVRSGHFVTDSQSVCPSWPRAPNCDSWPYLCF